MKQEIDLFTTKNSVYCMIFDEFDMVPIHAPNKDQQIYLYKKIIIQKVTYSNNVLEIVYKIESEVLLVNKILVIL